MSSSDSLIEETPAKRRRNDVAPQDDTETEVQESKKPSRPAFSAALLSSAFYCGPTMYGGAGACNTRSPYNKPSAAKAPQAIRVTPAKTEDSKMSQTSRRIMELLEQYSSPASDARRAPAAVTSPWRAPLAPALPSPRRAPPNQPSPSRYKELQVPGLANLMRIKAAQPSQTAQRAIAASLSSSQPYKPPQKYRITETQHNQQQQQHAYKPKMRARINGHVRHEERNALPEETRHNKLENISLVMPEGVTPKMGALLPKHSRPDHSQGITVTRKFVFSEPLDVIDDTTGTLKNIPDVCKDEEGITRTPKRKDSWLDSNFTLKKSNVRKEDEPKPPLPNGDVKSSLGSLIAQQKKQWECDTCLSRNDQAHTRCASCQAEKPNGKPANSTANFLPSKAITPPAKADSGLAELIKQQQKQWECDSCMARNDPSKQRCVCCETPRPGASPKPAPGPTYPGMADFIKKQQQQWECPCCMTRNDDNKAKCVCCEAAKPGTEPQTKSTFNFGNSNLSGAFKFGIDKADSPAVSNSSVSLPSLISASTAAPAVTSATFTFGVPAATSVPPTSQLPKVNSVFGGDKTNAVLTTGFTFGVKPAETKEKSPASVAAPSLSVTPLSSSTEAKPAASSISGSVASLPTHTPASAASLTLPISSPLSAAPPPTLTTPATTPVAEVKPPANTFMFSSPIKTSTDLASKVTPVENKKSEFPSSIFKSPATVNSIAKESPAAVPAPSPVSAPTPAAPPAFLFGSAAPVKSPPGTFNFGSAATVAPSPFKDSSTFTFGNKAPTPATPDLKTPTNNFAAPLSSTPTPAPTSLFSNPASQTSTPQFSAQPLADKPKFSFGSSAASTPVGSDMFKPGAATPVFAFGASAKKEATTPSLFGTPSKPDPVALGPFGSRPAETPGGIFGAKLNEENKTASPFGSAAPPSFGAAASSPFGSGSVPTFGAPRPPTASPFAGASPAFGSGSFGAPDPSPSAPFTFGSPTAPSAAPITFGSSPAAATPQFGASVPFTDPNSSAPRAAPFKFGQAAPGGFAPTPSPMFSFGSPSGAATPDFSFNMGAPSSAFPQSPAGAPQRRIKKAVRRNVQR